MPEVISGCRDSETGRKYQVGEVQKLIEFL